MTETTMVTLGREKRKRDEANSSVTPFPIKYWPICYQGWTNKPSTTASKCRWNSDATSEHMGRRGEERDMLNKTKPKTKSTHLNSKREVQKLFMSLYRSVSTPEKPKHYQQQSKLQAALKNTKEHEDTNFYILTAKTFNSLNLADRATNHRQPELLQVDWLSN